MLKQGLYEQLINQELKEEIRSAEAAERQRVETGLWMLLSRRGFWRSMWQSFLRSG